MGEVIRQVQEKEEPGAIFGRTSDQAQIGEVVRHKELLIIMPAYNEAGNIGKVFDNLEESGITKYADVLVMNDASSDSTTDIVREYCHTVITHVFNLGYGSGLQLGYKYAVRRNYKYVIQMDADGQHDVSNVPRILAKLKEKDENGKYPDIVLGARFREDSAEFKVGTFKKIAYVYFRFLIKLATGKEYADPTTGLQGLSRRAITYCAQYNQFEAQYPDANVIIQMTLLGFRIAEIPAVMHIRESGVSMHSGFKPIAYMVRMTTSILAVIFRIKALHWKAAQVQEDGDADDV